MLGLAVDEAMFLHHRKKPATAGTQRAGGDSGAASPRRLGAPREAREQQLLRLAGGDVSPRRRASLPCRGADAAPAVLLPCCGHTSYSYGTTARVRAAGTCVRRRYSGGHSETRSRRATKATTQNESPALSQA